jgi:hypothetical protein
MMVNLKETSTIMRVKMKKWKKNREKVMKIINKYQSNPHLNFQRLLQKKCISQVKSTESREMMAQNKTKNPTKDRRKNNLRSCKVKQMKNAKTKNLTIN